MNLFKLLILTLLIFTSKALAQTSNDFLSDLNSELEAQKDSFDPFQGEEVEIDIDTLDIEGDKKINESEDINLNLQDEDLNDDLEVDNIDNINNTTDNNLTDKKNEEIKSKDDFSDNLNESNKKNEEQIKENNETRSKNSDIKDKSDEKKIENINNDQSNDNVPNQTKAIRNLFNKFSDAITGNNDEKNEAIKDQENQQNLSNQDDQVKEESQDNKSDISEEIITNKLTPEEQEYENLRKEYLDYIKNGNTQIPIKTPIEKDINRYIIDEVPALPILSRYRTNENLHVPIIPTPYERIDSLFQAISMQNVGYFNSSYKYVQNPNVFNRQGDNLLTYSIIYKSYPTLISALNKGADPNLANKLGYTPATIAIELKDLKALKMLFDNGADINFKDKFGRNYLMYASRVGFLPAVDFFIKKGIDINAMDNDGFTALAIAYKNNRQLAIKYLIKNGAKTWAVDSFQPKSGSLMESLENRWK